jgi:carbonic anhydrase
MLAPTIGALSLSQWQIHNFSIKSPSEHTINGDHFDLEIQIVHSLIDANVSKPYAILSLLFEEGDESEFLANLLAAENLRKVTWHTLLPTEEKIENYYAYYGSETREPCRELI